MRNVFAYTDVRPVSYPEYVSINEVDGEAKVTVRSPRSPDGREGATASMTLPPDQLARLAVAFQKYLPSSGS